jgi:DNA-binding transcriptional LysR family regulator
MVSEFRDLSGEVSDILHVGISQTRSRILMPSILLRMHSEFPRVQVRLTEQTNEVLVKKLLKGELDLMIGDVPDHPEIRKEVMYRESIVLTVSEKLISKKQLAALTRTKDIRILAGIPFVMNTQNDIAGRYGSSIMESFSLIPRIAAVSDSAETCLQMCLDGLGAYICPDLYVRFYRDRFAALHVIPLDCSYGICLASGKGLYEKRSVREFWKYCLETGREALTGNPVTE